MGVSLERVQNKFACIIGELCNEPVVLSKFAIWLDLRLAEYKAKGAISLDCSGESPDPVWLKGHDKPHPVLHKADDRSHRLGNVGNHEVPVFNYGSNVSQTPDSQETNFGFNSSIMKDINERLSPEIVVVKEEHCDLSNSENIYPVSLQYQQNKSRKRSSTDILPISITKAQRLVDDSCLSVVQTGTQSLMSIIGETRDDMKEEHLIQSKGDNIMTFSPHTSTMSAADHSFNQASISADESSSSLNFSSQSQLDQSFCPTQTPETAGSWTAPVCESQDAQHLRHVNTTRLSKYSVRHRIPHKSSKSKNTVNQISSAVGHLQRFLYSNHNEARDIEKIPSNTLNEYLCNFFDCVKQPGGSDYIKTTLTALRSYIERFLQENGYPYSISHSKEFQQSQYALDQRRRLLSKHKAV